LIFFLRISLSEAPPQYGSVFRSGQNLLISSAQLFKTDEGATTRNGPHIFFSYIRQLISGKMGKESPLAE